LNRHHKWKSLTTHTFRKKLQTFDRTSLTFDRISPIADLWDKYASQVDGSEQSIARMDLHGAQLTVLSSPDPSFAGVTGRVVKESFGAIIIVSEDNKVRQLNKNHTVIRLETPLGPYEVNLSAICFRPSMKATKKWKQRIPVILPY
jgi:RNase P/RNase MRP subunit p29